VGNDNGWVKKKMVVLAIKELLKIASKTEREEIAGILGVKNFRVSDDKEHHSSLSRQELKDFIQMMRYRKFEFLESKRFWTEQNGGLDDKYRFTTLQDVEEDLLKKFDEISDNNWAQELEDWENEIDIGLKELVRKTMIENNYEAIASKSVNSYYSVKVFSIAEVVDEFYLTEKLSSYHAGKRIENGKIVIDEGIRKHLNALVFEEESRFEEIDDFNPSMIISV
jgi:hypothetical protein